MAKLWFLIGLIGLAGSGVCGWYLDKVTHLAIPATYWFIGGIGGLWFALCLQKSTDAED